MNKCYVRIDVDREAAIRAGRGEYGEHIVLVDPSQLTPAQRDELLRCPTYYSDGALYYWPHGDGSGSIRPLPLPPVPDASMASLGVLLDARPAALAERERERAERAAAEAARTAEREAQERARAAEWAELPIEWRVTAAGSVATCRPAGTSADYRGPLDDSGYRVVSEEALGAYAPEALAEARELAARRREELEARAAAEAAAKVAALREWAEREGSERLRLMLELDEGDWQAVARDEWFAAHSPVYEGRTCDRETAVTGERHPRRKPLLHELRALQAFRELAAQPESPLRDPRLLWVEVEGEGDADDAAEPERYCILAVDLVAPDGHVRTVAVRL